MKRNESQFSFIGNSLAVDFVNTEVVERGQVIELLNSPAEIVRWAGVAGISVNKQAESNDLDKALELRAALKALFSAKVDGLAFSSNAIMIVNKVLLNHSTEQKLIQVEDRLELQPVHQLLSLDKLFARIAHDAAWLLSSERSGQLKRCSNPKCILMFLDTSRAKKRRWCSMEVCGNRAKAANHYLTHGHL